MRMLTVSVVALGLLSVGSAQIKMRVLLNGQPVGVTSVTQKMNPDGSKTVALNMELKSGGTAVTLRSESSYASNGMPLRKYQETVVPSQKSRRARIATFDSKGANLVEDVNGKRSTRQIPLDPKASRADMSEFWFIRDKPKPGDKVTCYTFNLDTLAWEMVETEYKGVVDLTIGGKKYKAHKAVNSRGAAYFDQQGDPLRLEFDTGAMERIN